jgi:hypothetical protein
MDRKHFPNSTTDYQTNHVAALPGGEQALSSDPPLQGAAGAPGCQPLVSVILPVYNGERYIQQAIESARRQTHTNLEIICVDDGSTDGTVAIAEALAAIDARIRIMRQPNGGVARARNCGLSAARGEFIAPLDADDLWDVSKIERQVRRMQEAGPDIGMVYCWWVWINEQGAILDRSPEWRIEENASEMLLQINFTGNASVPLYRRSCLDTIGGYDETLEQRRARGCEDWDLAIKISERYPIAVEPAVLVGYRRLPESMSTQCEVMRRSQQLVTEAASDRQKGVSAAVLRRASDQFALYVAGVLFRSGAYFASFRWAVRAWRSGLLFKVLPHVVRVIATRLLRGHRAPRPVMLPGGKIDADALGPALIPYDTIYGGVKRRSWIERLLKSRMLQISVLVLAFCFAAWLHRSNDGLWYQGDSPRHATNGLFWYDLITTLPRNPAAYAASYYARYPVIQPAAYPPLFYLLEGFSFRVFGPQPANAKLLVLGFAIMAGLYTMAWARRWLGEELGWAGMFVICVPGVLSWTNAVMLNVPALASGVAALYHWRRWLETGQRRQAIVSGCLAAASLSIYYPGAIVVLIALGWLAAGLGRVRLSLRYWLVMALIPAAVFAVSKIAPRLVQRNTPTASTLFRLETFTYYPSILPALLGPVTLILGLAGLSLAVLNARWRREAMFLAAWAGIVLSAFSVLPAKEPRYLLVIAPAFVLAAALGVAALRPALSHMTPGIGAAFLATAIVAGLTVVAMHSVPRKSGFRAIVRHLERIAPEGAILYDGYHDGLFGFYFRAGDPGFRRRLMLAEHVLYQYGPESTFEWVEHLNVKSASDIAFTLRTRSGCQWVAVEVGSYSEWGRGAKLLREAVRGPDFELVRSFPIAAFNVERVDLYRLSGPVKPLERVTLSAPSLSGETWSEVEPISRSK